VLTLLEQAWRQDTGSATGQLISNALSTRHGIFGVEDDKLETALRAWLDQE